jgi:hypothetical protein
MEENLQAQIPTTKSVGLRYGAIMGVVSIVIFLIMTLSGIDINGPAKWASYPVYIVLIFLAHKYYKDNGDGYMRYSQGIGIAFWMSLVSSAISSIFTYIYVKFIDASFIDMIKEKQLEQFQEKGMSDSQIEQAMKISEMFMKPESFLIIGLIAGIIGTIIMALIVSIFTQKNNPQQAI